MTGSDIRAIIICSFLLVGCGGRRKDDVVVIEKTKSYHTDQCPRVNMANTKTMTVEEARAMNCQPCKGCRPDTKE
jgi:hypothetical protein